MRKLFHATALLLVLIISGNTSSIAQNDIEYGKYLSSYFKIPAQPLADPKAIVTEGNARFTILTPQLIRIEYSPVGKFEDRPTQVIWNRKQAVPKFTVNKSNNKLEIVTEYLSLEYTISPQGFAEDNLSIKGLKDNFKWQFGDEGYGNLGGTARTLDGAHGTLNLGRGLMARGGYTLINDARSLIFNDYGWIEPRFKETDKKTSEKTTDLYFFGYGRDYKKCLSDFIKVSGEVPMIPRYVLGNWWSRLWPYTTNDYENLMTDFKKHKIPISICVIDMFWHTDNSWGGYTWNKKLIPDPPKLFQFFKNNGIKTVISDHPAEGIESYEEKYVPIAQYLGIDPSKKKNIQFNCTDPKYMDALFKYIHHPIEEMGADFWWNDYQSSTTCQIPGLDPMWWLNHLFYLDLARDGKKRGLNFTRYAGLGSHRYPVGFSGDAFGKWDMLAFEPYLTSTASNVGFGWWSHDIGGFQRGENDPEIYTRWIQMGVFSPIMRLHAINIAYFDKIPWHQDATTFNAVKDVMQLRQSLIPYLYSMVWRENSQARMLIEPMYYNHPDNEEAYLYQLQYYFGSELIASPFVTPKDPSVNLSRQSVWLPKGKWFDFFTGEYYNGDKVCAIYGNINDIPVFAKAGAIVPLTPKSGQNSVENPEELEIHIFPGENNSFELYEDDGTTTDYKKGKYCITQFEQKFSNSETRFTIHAAEGETNLVPDKRSYKLIFKGINKPLSIETNIKEFNNSVDQQYDTVTNILTLYRIQLTTGNHLSVVLKFPNPNVIADIDRTEEKLVKMLQSFKLDINYKLEIDNSYHNYQKSKKNDVSEFVRRLNTINFQEYLSETITANQINAILETMIGRDLVDYILTKGKD